MIEANLLAFRATVPYKVMGVRGLKHMKRYLV